MDPEQTFLRVHARLSGVLSRLLTPRFRAALEYLCLWNALMLLALLVVMHVNFVAQPGCSAELSTKEIAEAQLVQIKITGSWNLIAEDYAGSQVVSDVSSNGQDSTGEVLPGQGGFLISHIPSEHKIVEVDAEDSNLLAAKFWLNLLGNNVRRGQTSKRFAKIEGGASDISVVSQGSEDDTSDNVQFRSVDSQESLGPDTTTRSIGPGRGPLGTALFHYVARWSNYVTVLTKRAEQSVVHMWQIWRLAGWEPLTSSPKGERSNLGLNKPESVSVDSTEKRKVLDPTYLYSVEKGYLMLSESSKFQHNIRTVNVTISADNSCFGNNAYFASSLHPLEFARRWQQLLIDNFVGYDTILMNSLLASRQKGFLYNFQTKELYNLNYLQEFSEVPHGFEDYIVFKCGVLITSLFVFFTTTMSVSFTLRETQARMLKFTVQLQHHARHRLPTYRLIFVHVIESLVFVPIMIGILFFLFEFFDDQLLAFMVLTLVWLCELFTMISVRTPLSMQYFPRFFFLYFMVFHVYFFSYTYGFSYLAFSATAAFMQHLVLYFWNRFEVPALQLFLRRRALLQQQGLHITSSAILTSAVQVARFSGNGDVRNVTINSSNSRGFEFRHTEAASGHTYTDRGGARDARATQPPVDDQLPSGRPHVSTVEVNTGLGSLVGESGGRESGSERTSGSDMRRVRPLRPLNTSRESGVTGGTNARDRGSVGQSEHGGGQQPGPVRTNFGPLSSLGNVLPWFWGHSSGNLVSFLPIFRDFQDTQELHSGGVTTNERGEDGPVQRVDSGEGLRLRRRTGAD